MAQNYSQNVIEACSNLFKKIYTTVAFSASSIDCELYVQLERAHSVLLQSLFRTTPLLAKELSKLASVSFAAHTNSIKSTDISSNTDENREDLYNQDGNYISFLQSNAVWSIVLSAFYFKKRKLSEKALIALNNLLLCQEVNFNILTKLFRHPYTNTSGARSSEALTSPTTVPCSVGEGVFEVLTEFLGTTSDSNEQLLILFRLKGLLNGKGQNFLVGQSITRILRSVFTVVAWTCEESIRECCHRVLELCVLCVTRRFVDEMPSVITFEDGASKKLSYRFSTTTPLDDYTTHVPQDAPYTHIDVVDTSVPVDGEERRAFTATGELHQIVHNSSSSTTPALFDPRRMFLVALEELTLRCGAQALRPQPSRLPAPLKGLLLLLRVVCEVASDPCPGQLNDSNVGPQLRQLALGLLQLVFSELPVANCTEEHPCSIWMSLILFACGFEVIGCLVCNLSAEAPFLLFNSAIHILKLLLIKCHYHLGRELHGVIVAFLLPLARSKHYDFRQKYAVLSMIRDLFSLPHLLISFFVNYDCNPAIGADGYSGGMLETLVDFVVELAYLDCSCSDREDPPLNQEEKQLLRYECFMIMHIFTNSLYRWIAEDPEAPVPSPMEETNACRGGIERMPNKPLVGVDSYWVKKDSVGEFCGPSTATELLSTLKSSYDTVNFSLSHVHSSVVSANLDPSAELSQPGDTSQGKELTRNTAMLFGESCIQYHWKHLHHQLANKRILKKAAHMVNAGEWKEAKRFLESRKCLPVRLPSEEEQRGGPVAGGSSSYSEFARFLYEYPGISRDSLNKIIARVNKKEDHANLLLLGDYVSLFPYQGVPIDIAFRDTLCKFVSWEAPMFEPQVWETIQAIFGEAYAKQNPLVITAKDADAMAGALLFLHTNFHNSNAKNAPMSLDQFISASAEFLDFPPDVEDLRKIFERTKQKKWDLDIYDRTPQEAERQLRQDQVSSSLFSNQLLSHYRGGKSTQSCQPHGHTLAVNLFCADKDATGPVTTGQNESATQGTLSAGDGAEWLQTQSKQEKNAILNFSGFDVGEHKNNTIIKLQALKVDLNISETSLNRSENNVTSTQANDYATNIGSGYDCDSISTNTYFNMPFSPRNIEDFFWFPLVEIDLLNSRAPAYTKHMEKLKVRGGRQAESFEVSKLYLKKLEVAHMRFFSNYADYHPQPYVFPYYAEHVQPLLLLTYPKVMASIYLGFNVTEVAPLRYQLLETLQRLYDIASAFMINVGDYQTAVAETVQQYLSARDADRLMSQAQATLVPLLLNHL